MIDQTLVFLQLSQKNEYISAVELAIALEASVVEVRHCLQDLGDLVECNGDDEWRVVRNIAPERILSVKERRERQQLEKQVAQAFYIAGTSLKALRDKRLYRETHPTFEAYIRDRFDFTRRAADYLISGALVVENLKREQFVLKTNVLPTKESQCRPLAKLSPEQQVEIWNTAVQAAKGIVPSAKLIKEIIDSDKPGLKLNPKPENKELVYKPGSGIDYVVHLDEKTYKLLQKYQDKIGTATKNGAIRRLLDNAIAE